MSDPVKNPISHPEKKEQKFRYFEDEDCRVPLYTIRFPEPVLRGEEKAVLTVVAKNITQDELDNLEWVPNDAELEIEQTKTKVGPLGMLKLKFIFTPSEKREKELDSTFVVRGRAIRRGSQ